MIPTLAKITHETNQNNLFQELISYKNFHIEKFNYFLVMIF